MSFRPPRPLQPSVLLQMRIVWQHTRTYIPRCKPGQKRDRPNLGKVNRNTGNETDMDNMRNKWAHAYGVRITDNR
ncbi:hypothetical protein OUZ56_029002 [Daphnia magna]|uniref:Uncharacterized protein n=1 Tax=Daphnia magna TaxID=35525 RepID=A0ABR0B5I7_9CRUS|nr:hypothetical protein OUZ56_029002 [Daphnia magna]